MPAAACLMHSGDGIARWSTYSGLFVTVLGIDLASAAAGRRGRPTRSRRSGLRGHRGGEWLLWQFANCGRMPGVTTFIDLNVFNGPVAEFQRLRCLPPA